MNFKKILSCFLALLILFPNYFIEASCVDINTNQTQKEIIFVTDEKIIIDSVAISNYFSEEKAKDLCFVKPDENSENILSKELFPNGSPKPEDIQQGNLGMCYFLAVLSTVAEKDPKLLMRNLVDDGNGNIIVKFFNPNNGKPFYIKVQKTVPKLADEYKFLKNDCLWVHMYLKAFVASGFAGNYGGLSANCAKSYKNVEGGFMHVAIRMITGKESKIKNAASIFLSNKNKLYDEFKFILSNNGYICCDFTSHLNIVKLLFGKLMINGIVRKHSYSVEKVYEDKEGQRWIVIRNPWNFYTATYDEKGKRIKNSEDNNGYSTLKWEDFLSECGRVEYSIDEPIKTRSIFKRFMDFIDPIPYTIRVLEYLLINKGMELSIIRIGNLIGLNTTIESA